MSSYNILSLINYLRGCLITSDNSAQQNCLRESMQKLKKVDPDTEHAEEIDVDIGLIIAELWFNGVEI